MFIINHNSYQPSNSRRTPDQTVFIPPVSDADATQRVSVTGRTPAAPQRNTAPRPASNRQPPRSSGRRPSGKKSKETVIIIVLLTVAAILLIGVIAAASILLRKPVDDGLIPSNVFAAGVNLGGMTEEAAKQALIDATKDTYTKLDMTVQVLDTTVTLPAQATHAKLDVDAVVAAAMASSNNSTVSVLPHLNLDTTYIRTVVDELGKQYSSTLTQGTIDVEGTKPTEPQDSYDTEKAYQTLVIYMGTAEYGLSTDDLYDQIMDAYDINLFQVVGQCSVMAPDPLNLETIYQSICSAPIDASLDTTTYEVTKEVYGYGFDLAKANEMMAMAQYGETIRLPICFIQPDITAEMLTTDLFRDVLAEFSTEIFLEDSDDLSDDTEIPLKDTALLVNLKLACKAINNLLIKSGESFSFSQATGQPSIGKGYQALEIFQGTELVEVIGGGISQVATTLYNCALLSDLSIVERHVHSYAPSYVDPGLDAMVNWGSADLIFKNTTDYPIRIEAEVVDNHVVIRLIGTDNNDYYISIETEVVEHKPTTLHQSMLEDNIGNYVEGDVLVEGITGYDVIVYRNLLEKETNRQLSSNVQTYDRYQKRNEVVVSIYQPAEDPDTSLPTTPSTGPSGSTEPTTNPTTEPTTAPTAGSSGSN